MEPRTIRGIRTFCYWSNLALGFTGKIPQVWALEGVKDEEKMSTSTSSLYIEILGHLIIVCYHLKLGSDMSLFFENINATLQSLVLLFIILNALSRIKVRTFIQMGLGFGSVGLLSNSSLILYRRAPPLYQLLIRFAHPILSLSKMVQLHHLWWVGHSENLSLETWLISAYCSAARIVFLILEGSSTKSEAEIKSTEVANLSMSCALSLAIVGYALFLRRRNAKNKKKSTPSKKTN